MVLIAKTRTDLQKELETLLGSRNVYYNPPETLQMKYPCFVYNFREIQDRKADDTHYNMRTSYSLQYITSRVDSKMRIKVLEHFQFCRFDRFFVSDGLNHDNFVLYY